MVPRALTGPSAIGVRRVTLALKLASESIRNWPEVTTFSPGLSPSTISTQSPLSMPLRTSRASKRPSPRAMITRSWRPVRISASSGMATTSFFGPP